jgi:hypothetical protein
MARSPDLSRGHQDLLRDFLRGADLVKFAQFVPSEQDIEQSIAAARRFLEETRQITEAPRGSRDAAKPAAEVAHA